MSATDQTKPKRGPGRPSLPPDAPRSTAKTRSVRLDAARWAKLRRLGREWLERVIDEAQEPR